MPTKSLIFIPDISGFTDFVNQTEISHAQHIITELLEGLIDDNILDLQLSEIEGDALLFHLQDHIPTAQQLVAQVKKMYKNFHYALKKYESYRICNCGACTAAHNLKIKFIVHSGQVAINKIKGQHKLFGKDVIIAHRLLKNSISEKEYLLTSSALDSLFNKEENPFDFFSQEIFSGEDEYDGRSISYNYVSLAPLQDEVPNPSIIDHTPPEVKDYLFGNSIEINAPIGLVFNVVSDLSFRHHFFHGLKGSDRINHHIPQAGTTHRCVISDNENDPFFITQGFAFENQTITFVENEERKKISNVFTITKLEKTKTRVKLDIFGQLNWVTRSIFNLLLRRKYSVDNSKTLLNLEKYCEKLYKEKKEHSSVIVLPQEYYESFNE